MSQTDLPSVCVFCGSNPGADPAFRAAAAELGRLLAREGVRLVYGGGNVGLMGVIADAVLAAGGEAIGVIPHALASKELAHQGLTQLHVVDSMHERKAMMADLAGGFVAMPGGLGTFEEILEIITWAQLGIHAKPCALLNVSGYYDKLIDFLDHAVSQQLLMPAHRAMLLVHSRPDDLLRTMREYAPPTVEKWIRREDT